MTSIEKSAIKCKRVFISQVNACGDKTRTLPFSPGPSRPKAD